MSDSSADQGRDTADQSGAKERGPSQVPEESPDSESDLALSEQAKQRDAQQDDK